MPPWCRSEKRLAWLGLTFIILTSALSLGSEHSIPTAVENSWSRARLPSELFNLLRLAMLQQATLTSLEALPGGEGIMPQARATPRVLRFTSFLPQPVHQPLERSDVEIPGPPAEPPDSCFPSLSAASCTSD